MARLVLLVIFFLTSLLSLFKAPMYYLWLLAIAVTEYPLVFATIVIALLLSGIRIHKYKLAGTLIGSVSLLLFLSPVLRSYIAGATLPEKMNSGLGVTNPPKAGKPFSFVGLFASLPRHDYSVLTFATHKDIKLDLDFYAAPVSTKRPCVVVIHGGSWSSGDSRQLPELNSYLANAGYNVAAINYRKAPQYKSPLPVDDVKDALNYLRDNADSLNIDTNQFVLLGRSAGAQIALLAGYTLKDAGIAGVINFYGPADMVWGYSAPASPLVMDSRGVMERYLGGKYEDVPNNYFNSSPIEFVDNDSPPTLIIHGENDVLVAYEHSRRLNDKLQQSGIRHYWLKLPWATHGFDYNLYGPGGQLSTYAVHKFLNIITKNTFATHNVIE